MPLHNPVEFERVEMILRELKQEGAIIIELDVDRRERWRREIPNETRISIELIVLRDTPVEGHIYLVAGTPDEAYNWCKLNGISPDRAIVLNKPNGVRGRRILSSDRVIRVGRLPDLAEIEENIRIASRGAG